MAIVDLTKFDPYAADTEGRRRAQESQAKLFAGIANSISSNIQAGVERRRKSEERNREIRDREYALAQDATGKTGSS